MRYDIDTLVIYPANHKYFARPVNAYSLFWNWFVCPIDWIHCELYKPSTGIRENIPPLFEFLDTDADWTRKVERCVALLGTKYVHVQVLMYPASNASQYCLIRHQKTRHQRSFLPTVLPSLFCLLVHYFPDTLFANVLFVCITSHSCRHYRSFNWLKWVWIIAD